MHYSKNLQITGNICKIRFKRITCHPVLTPDLSSSEALIVTLDLLVGCIKFLEEPLNGRDRVFEKV